MNVSVVLKPPVGGDNVANGVATADKSLVVPPYQILKLAISDCA